MIVALLIIIALLLTQVIRFLGGIAKNQVALGKILQRTKK